MMKKQYEAPEAKTIVFASQQNLAFDYDQLDSLLGEPQDARPGTNISQEDSDLSCVQWGRGVTSPAQTKRNVKQWNFKNLICRPATIS